jgi:hypothetical protein
VFTAVDQQIHSTPCGLLDYDEFRQALRAMSVDTRGIDIPLIFYNYSDDGVNLDYSLWIDRIGLGRCVPWQYDLCILLLILYIFIYIYIHI